MTLRALTLAAAVATGATPALAFNPECGLYQYEAKVVSVYDGDTVRADIDLGFNTWRHNEPLRLHGIDTPELRGKGVTDAEKADAEKARDALREKILGKAVLVCTIKDRTGKYGRYLARIFVDGENVNEWLLREGYAVPYE